MDGLILQPCRYIIMINMFRMIIIMIAMVLSRHYHHHHFNQEQLSAPPQPYIVPCRMSLLPDRTGNMIVCRDYWMSRTPTQSFKLCSVCPPPPSQKASYVISCSEHNRAKNVWNSSVWQLFYPWFRNKSTIYLNFHLYLLKYVKHTSRLNLQTFYFLLCACKIRKRWLVQVLFKGSLSWNNIYFHCRVKF